MHEFFLQHRADEIRAEMLRDAAARQLIREARAALRAQRSASTTRATTRTPSSMSDAVTCP